MLVVRTRGRAPEDGAAWTVLVRGEPPEDLVGTLATRGIDVRARVQVCLRRSAQDQVCELGGSPYGVLWRGRRTVAHKLAGPPYDGLVVAGSHAAAGAGLPFVGLSAAVVAERLGRA
jgi:UDP-galactopyranose mutase